MDINTRKKLLRQEYISIRKSVKDKQQKSMQIAKKLLADEWYKEAKTVALYKSLASEVDTAFLIERALADGKRVVLPKVFGDYMRFFEIQPGEKLIKSSFGVLEPEGDETKYVSPELLDLVIVPGLCFDRDKHRLGFGRGYYDRFLCSTNAKTIGVCFSAQTADANVIPTDRYDVKMQRIITECEIY